MERRGKKRKFDHDAIVRDREDGMSVKEIAFKHGCAQSQVYNVINLQRKRRYVTETRQLTVVK